MFLPRPEADTPPDGQSCGTSCRSAWRCWAAWGAWLAVALGLALTVGHGFG